MQALSWKDFWQPITSKDVRFQFWRKSHILAHIIGGAFWWIFTLAAFRPLLTSTPALRLLMVTGVQLMWERVQQENFGNDSSGYPWWSALWDVLFALMGASVVEILYQLLF